jgi:hypothetical protein
MPSTDPIAVDLRLPDSELEEAELFAAAERVFPGDLVGLFWLNGVWKQTGLGRRDDDDWRA